MYVCLPISPCIWLCTWYTPSCLCVKWQTRETALLPFLWIQLEISTGGDLPSLIFRVQLSFFSAKQLFFCFQPLSPRSARRRQSSPRLSPQHSVHQGWPTAVSPECGRLFYSYPRVSGYIILHPGSQELQGRSLGGQSSPMTVTDRKSGGWHGYRPVALMPVAGRGTESVKSQMFLVLFDMVGAAVGNLLT